MSSLPITPAHGFGAEHRGKEEKLMDVLSRSVLLCVLDGSVRLGRVRPIELDSQTCSFPKKRTLVHNLL